MPGTFTHLTAVSCIYKSRTKRDNLSKPHKKAIVTYSNFCELGAVSPDYPYLRIGSKTGEFWANEMHHAKTGEFVRAAIPLVAKMDPGDAKDKCTAWLFGYASHLVADMTLHPVITLKVGKYEKHKEEHRRCEMNQDVYIFNRKQKMRVTMAEYLDSGLATCIGADRGLFKPLASLWRDIFAKLRIAANGKPPRPGLWHKSFVFLHDKFAEEGGVLPFSRHFTDRKAITYPELEDVDPTYISYLATPLRTVEDFEPLFDMIVTNVLNAWCELDKALADGKPKLFTLPNGDLDSGLVGKRSVFWEPKA